MNAAKNFEEYKFESFYGDLSIDDYHNDSSSISRSAIMDFRRSPKRYWAKYLNPDRPKREVKDVFKFGNAFHIYMLEPAIFNELYIVKPEPVLLKNVGKIAYNLYKESLELIENSNKIILSTNEFNTILAMAQAIRENQKANELIQNAKYETSYFWKDKESGLIVKARPDILHENMYVDLKTIVDASPHNYQREMANFGYHIQAAMVKDAIKTIHNRDLLACINVCIEKTYPYSIGIYIIDELAIEKGQELYKQTLIDMKRAIEHNQFNDYEIATVGLPGWYT